MRTIVPILGMLLFALPAIADPLYIAKHEDTVVVLYSTPCKLDSVSNLKRRATWQDKNGSHEGCWGSSPQMGLVILYFADKTVVAMPTQFFEKASGA